MELLVKPVLYAALLGVFLLFVRTIYLGRRVKDFRVFQSSVIAPHRKAGVRLWWAMLGFVVLIEGTVRLKGGSEFDLLLIIHCASAVLSFIGLSLLTFWFTGFKTKHHGRIAYITFALFLVAAYIGIPMIQSRF